MDDEHDRAPPPPSEAVAAAPAGWRVRRWPLGLGLLLVAVSAWVAVTAWGGVRHSNPIGGLTLLVAAGAGAAMVAWSMIAGPRPERSAARTWTVRAVSAVLVGATVVIVVYTKPLTAEPVAVAALSDDDRVSVDDDATRITMRPRDPAPVGLAFYPGAKVDPRAYARILRPIAEAGYPVVVFKQPYNLAVLDIDAADAVIGDPDDAIDVWVVGGHSLGGAMAARYAVTDRDELTGLLLHAAYPADDMSQRDLAVASVWGTRDAITTPSDIADSVPELPPDAVFTAIDGAIHSQFGDYGLQKGDGVATIDRPDAQRQIVEATLAFLDGLAP